MATRTLPKVHILSTGIWNGVPITSQDLVDMVSSFAKAGFKPVLKLGHSKNQNLLKQALKSSGNGKLQKDGFPSAGILTAIEKEGKKLFATIADIPEKIATIIENRGFHRFSIEAIRSAVNSKGEKLPMVLTALGLLGEDIPAVENLDDHLALFSNDNIKGDGEIIYFTVNENDKQNNNKKEGTEKMSDDFKKKEEKQKLQDDEIARLKKENEKLKLSKESQTSQDEKFKTLQDQMEEQNKTLKFTQKSFEAEKALRVEAEKKGKQEKIDILLSKAVDDQKIFPAQKELYKGLMLSVDDKNKDIIILSKDNKEEKLTGFDAIQKIIDINSILLTKEELQQGETPPDQDDQEAKMVAFAKKSNSKIMTVNDLSPEEFKLAYSATGEGK